MVPKLKYPVLFVHGMGFRDNKLLCYWGRIPKLFEKGGNSVFFGNQDSNADIETNGQYIAKRINEIIKETGSKKVNIIAHSKGGLESRYAISKLGMDSKVASLTTISTPHNGSKSIDLLMRLPKWLIKFCCFFTDCWFRIIGDKKPNTYNCIKSFSRKEAKKFNADVINSEYVYYQSYSFIMKNPTSDIFLFFASILVYLIEGENDGLLTPEATRWGEYKGIMRSIGRRGISHCDEVDMRRLRFTRKKGDGISDITEVYENIAVDLHVLGF